jgi:hypothetical protein
MIVKDETTLEQAMELTKQGRVWYHDAVMFSTNMDPAELRVKLTQRIQVGDIGIVALAGPQYYMEDYDFALKMIRKQRKVEEQKAIRHWVTEHPAAVRKVQERAEKAAKAKELQLA